MGKRKLSIGAHSSFENRHLDNAATKVKDTAHDVKVSLLQKLMLSSQLLGNEAAMTYEQLYAVPVCRKYY
jgi:hypothetical protein